VRLVSADVSQFFRIMKPTMAARANNTIVA
jgi:hypothetical protein